MQLSIPLCPHLIPPVFKPVIETVGSMFRTSSLDQVMFQASRKSFAKSIDLSLLQILKMCTPCFQGGLAAVRLVHAELNLKLALSREDVAHISEACRAASIAGMSAQRLAAARTVGAQLALRNSLKSKDAVRIDQACDAAEHTSVATHEIREGRAMAARLRAEGELYAAISAPSIEQLRKARASGARAGIDAALIREAERKTNQLCQNAILKATGTGCVQAVRAACSEAEHAGAAPSLVHEAMHTIARLQREEAETQLAEAMVSGCAGQIRVASAAAKDQGVSAEQVRQAEETATRIEAEVELAAVLLNAVERSAARLCSAADVIEAVGALDLHALPGIADGAFPSGSLAEVMFERFLIGQQNPRSPVSHTEHSGSSIICRTSACY